MQDFTIKYSYDSETKQYIAFVPELNLSDYGKNISDALKNLQKTLDIYIEEMQITNKDIEYA